MRNGTAAAPRDPAYALVPEYTELFDERLLSEYERDSIRARLEVARSQARHLLRAAAHAGDRGPRPDPIPFVDYVREVLTRERPGLKPGVARQVVDEVCRLYLWSSLSSFPLFHELTVVVPWWACDRTRRTRLEEGFDLLVRELLHGVVLSLQRVREEVLATDAVYLGHCACRSSGIARDLDPARDVPLLVGEPEARRLLDRVVDRAEALGPDRLRATTGPRLRSTLERLTAARAAGSPGYRLERLLAETWPHWELLPVGGAYRPNWVRSLERNGKCEPVDREVALELVNVFFHGRGAMFSSMKCVDSPYTICTCPTPEHGGGCVLTNWYYFGSMDASLVPADDHHGRRRDAEGRVLPCRYFPVRARRECLGCGCDHSSRRPRDLDASLAESDALLVGGRGGERPRS